MKKYSRCAICGISEDELKTRLHMYHNHQTGKLKSLLCERCNTTLGLVEEDVVLLDLMGQFLVSQQ